MPLKGAERSLRHSEVKVTMEQPEGSILAKREQVRRMKSESDNPSDIAFESSLANEPGSVHAK